MANTLFTLWTVLMLMSQSGSCAEITQDSHKRCPALRVPCHVDRAQWVETSVSAWRSEVQVLDQRTDIPPVALFHWNRNRCNEIATHLEHYSCKTVTGAHLFHPSLPSFVISTEQSEWRYPYRFHIKSIVSCTTCNAQNICSDLLKSMLRHWTLCGDVKTRGFAFDPQNLATGAWGSDMQ